MSRHQIAAKRKRKFVITTDSRHDLPVAENKLKQEFQATTANEKWVRDMDLLRVQHRLHLYPYERRLGISGSGFRLILQKNYWLVDGC
jgi:transposase InsO family protein